MDSTYRAVITKSQVYTDSRSGGKKSCVTDTKIFRSFSLVEIGQEAENGISGVKGITGVLRETRTNCYC